MRLLQLRTRNSYKCDRCLRCHDSLSPTTSDTVIGWLFRAEDDIDVISLGMWDFQENGFTLGSVEVGLWDVGGTLLASTTVLSTDSLSNGFRFSGITAVSLSAGMEYVVGGLSIAPEAYQFNAAVSNSPNVTWLESRATNSSTLVLPTGFIGTPGAFFGANFQYAEETVPAPATLALFGLGLMGLGWSRRRKI